MVSPELVTFAARVLERALQKSGYMPEPAAEHAQPSPADLFVDSVAERIVAFVQNVDAAMVAHRQSAIPSTLLDRLRARNHHLAMALGACVCFGEDVTCTECGGRGAPGWQLPDRLQFETLVRPALQTVSRVRGTGRGQLHPLQR